VTEKNWNQLTHEEKRAERVKRWLEPPDIPFVSPQAKKDYVARLKRFADAYRMKKPDRVPVDVPFGDLPLKWKGYTLKDAMYNYDLIPQVWNEFMTKFEMDTFPAPAMSVLPGRVYDMVGCHLYKYPGNGLPDNALGFQFAEGEYMMGDEYDALIKDPSDFWVRTYLPRVFTSFGPYRNISPFTSIVELPGGYFANYAVPEMQKTLKTFMEAGEEFLRYAAVVGSCVEEAARLGIPTPKTGGLAKAPFDTIGDTLRGTQGIMKDIYRHPDKLHIAMDRLADIQIEQAVNACNASGGLLVTFPLHKGADSFMSRKQFEVFYWPSLRKVINGLIDEGLIVFLFAEGSYMERLDMVNEFPKGTVVWRFDKTDMAAAYKALGDTCCLSGNVPASILSTGTPEAVKENCRVLIETCGRNGGYVLNTGCQVDMAPPENMNAMMEAALQYGVY
jgi:uroporphyrinogen-III decarboxylase